MKIIFYRTFFIILGLLLIGCNNSHMVKKSYTNQNISFDSLMKQESYFKNSKNFYTSNKWYEWDLGSDKGAMLSARKYCIQNGGLPMNYSSSFNQNSKNDSIPNIVKAYIKNFPKNNMDYSYTPCKKGSQTLFAVITEYKENKKNKTLKRYTFVKSDEIDKSITRKKKKTTERQRNIYQLKNRFGHYEDTYFTECKLGKLSINNQNKIEELFNGQELVCSSTCSKENEIKNGYSTLKNALDNDWKIIDKTNHFYAKEIKRDDGLICSCFGYKYTMFR